MPIKLNQREYRDMMLKVVDVFDEEEQQENRKKLVSGYATTFDQPYILYSDDNYVLYEKVDKRAFDNADMNDVIMQYDHAGRVMARISNGTLTVTPDEKGLYIVADLGGTDLGRDLYEEIRGRYTDKMSFGFTVSEDKFDEIERNGVREVTRTILGIGKLYDVSAVSIPANNATSISVRNLTDGVIQKIETERKKAHDLLLKKEKIKLKIKLGV